MFYTAAGLESHKDGYRGYLMYKDDGGEVAQEVEGP